MSPRNLDALIFDMGNVLIDWTPSRLVRHFVPDERWIEPLTKAIFHSSNWRLLDQGLIDETQVIEAVCAQFPEEIHPLITSIITRWPEANRFDQRMIPLTQRLSKKGIRLILGSNASLRFHTYQADIKALEVFEGIQISAEVKINKPDPRFFEILLSRFNLNPNRTGFIDDLQRNCEGAAALGIMTFHYTKDFEALLGWLKAQGVLETQDTVEETPVLS